MPLAHLSRQLARVGAQGDPGDGSRPLPRRLERLCGLLAAEEHTVRQVAVAVGVSPRTVLRVQAHPLVKARIAVLREQLRQAAYDAEPLADKRNRVIAAARTARRLGEQLAASDYDTIVGVTEAGTALLGHDRWRTQHLLDALALVDKMLASSEQTTTATAGTQTTLTIGDAVLRVQALLSRTSDTPEASH